MPLGSAVSACQTIAGSWPEIRRSARAMSRSRLMPGKTRMADFIARSLLEEPAATRREICGQTAIPARTPAHLRGVHRPNFRGEQTPINLQQKLAAPEID